MYRTPLFAAGEKKRVNHQACATISAASRPETAFDPLGVRDDHAAMRFDSEGIGMINKTARA